MKQEKDSTMPRKMEYYGKPYIAANDGKHAHRQLRENGNIQILAKKEGTREWVRITGKAALWNAFELSEKGQSSQLARMLKASLPMSGVMSLQRKPWGLCAEEFCRQGNVCGLGNP